jgi:hypothetical protein
MLCLAVLLSPTLVQFMSSSGLAQVAYSQGSGVVLSADGRPLPGVWVQELGARTGYLTGADGGFSFPAGKSFVMLFYKQGLRPEVRDISASDAGSNLSVVLRPESAATLNLRLCRRQTANPIHQLEIARVQGIRLRRAGDVDFASYSGAFRFNGAVSYISGMSGVHVGGLTPTPDWARGISSVTIRSFWCGEDGWLDLRGKSAGGGESRWIGYPFAFVEYSNVPSPVANLFDKAIDHGCCR